MTEVSFTFHCTIIVAVNISRVINRGIDVVGIHVEITIFK